MGICVSKSVEKPVIFNHDTFLENVEADIIAKWNEQMIQPYLQQMWINVPVKKINTTFYIVFNSDETIYYLPTVHVYQELKRIYRKHIIFTPMIDKTKIVGLTLTFL